MDRECLEKIRKITKDKITVFNFQKETEMNSKKAKINIIKVSAIACFVVMFSGVGLATSKVIEKIWKEPQKIESYYNNEGKPQKVTEQEKVNAITEEEAKQKAQEILKEFGKEDDEIVSVELENRPQNYDLTYRIRTQSGCLVTIDATNTNSYSFSSNILNQGGIDKYRGKRDELEKYVRELCQKHEINLAEYACSEVKTNTLSEDDAYIWYFYFYKKYGNIVNKHEEISIAIIPEINEILWFIVEKSPFEDNEIVVTEEEAKQIVLETEKKIPTGLEIKDVYVKLDIAKMNGKAYLREKDYEQYYSQSHTVNYALEDIVYYRTDDVVRRTWMVTVEYNLEKADFDSFYTYFVDVTTGEIIGGNESYHTSGITQ